MTTIELEEFAPGRWRRKKERVRAPRSDLPVPYVISDIMDPVEQVDGKFYSSKSQFRAVGRALGLTEVGNEKIKPRDRDAGVKADRHKRREAIKTSIEKFKAGQRVNTGRRSA